MKNEAIYEIAYINHEGHRGYKQVREARIIAACEELNELGYHHIEVVSITSRCDIAALAR